MTVRKSAFSSGVAVSAASTYGPQSASNGEHVDDLSASSRTEATLKAGDRRSTARVRQKCLANPLSMRRVGEQSAKGRQLLGSADFVAQRGSQGLASAAARERSILTRVVSAQAEPQRRLGLRDQRLGVVRPPGGRWRAVEGSGLLAGFSTYLLPEAAWLRQAVLGRLGQEWATPQTRRAVLESVEKLDFPSRTERSSVLPRPRGGLVPLRLQREESADRPGRPIWGVAPAPFEGSSSAALVALTPPPGEGLERPCETLVAWAREA
jgi:hypothetical protein